MRSRRGRSRNATTAGSRRNPPGSRRSSPKQRAELHLVGGVVLAVDELRAEQQLRESAGRGWPGPRRACIRASARPPLLARSAPNGATSHRRCRAASGQVRRQRGSLVKRRRAKGGSAKGSLVKPRRAKGGSAKGSLVKPRASEGWLCQGKPGQTKDERRVGSAKGSLVKRRRAKGGFASRSERGRGGHRASEASECPPI